MVAPICDKCGGEGLVPREGAESDKDIHPILSQNKTVCPKCGGGGRMPAPDARRQAIEAQQKAES